MEYYNKKVSCSCNDGEHSISLLSDNKGITSNDDIRFICPLLKRETHVNKKDLMILWDVDDSCFEIKAYRA